MGERIKRRMRELGLAAGDLIRATGLSKGAIYFILDGTTTPEKIRGSTVGALCEVLGMTQDELLLGKKAKAVARAGGDAEPGWDSVIGYSQSAGLGSSGIEAEEYAETHKLKFKASSLHKKRLNPKHLAIFYGRGDSMLPRIRDGDAIMFDQSDTRPRNKTVYVIQVHGNAHAEYQVKRAMIIRDNVYFVADNESGDHAWKDPHPMDDERSPITILGRVRWIGSWED